MSTDIENLKHQLSVVNANQKDMIQIIRDSVIHAKHKVSELKQVTINHNNHELQVNIEKENKQCGEPELVVRNHNSHEQEVSMAEDIELGSDGDDESTEVEATAAETYSMVTMRTVNRFSVLSDDLPEFKKPQRRMHSRVKQRRGGPGPKGGQEGIVFSTAQPYHLHAEQDRSGARSQDGNIVCSGVFVTQMNPKTIVRSLGASIKLHTGYSVRPLKLPTKYSRYSYFYIRCDKDMRDSLLGAGIWPRKSWAKPFYNESESLQLCHVVKCF